MAPLTDDQRKALKRSIAWLVIVALALFGALLGGNRPLKKTVRLDAVCRSFVAPASLTLKLHEGATEVQGATADGFEAAVANVASEALVVDGRPLNEAALQEFKLKKSDDVNQTPPRLDVKLSGGLGRTEMQVGTGVTISSFGTADGRPWVRAESAKAGDVEVTLVSTASTLTGNRYLVVGAGLPKRVVESFGAELKGAIPGVLVSLDSGAKDAAVKVWLRTQVDEQPLVGDESQNGTAGVDLHGEGGDGQLQLAMRGCVNPDLRIEDKSATGVIADRSTDLNLRAASGTIDEIGVTGGVGKTDGPRLRVRGIVEAKSLTQDGHELLPTIVSEAMDRPYAERSALLVFVGFLLFVAFKIVDRALSVLLEYLFPKVV